MLATKSGFDGVYIIITKNPKQLQVQLIKKGKAFLTIEDRDELAKILRTYLAKDPNDALLKVANRTLDMVADRLKSAKVDPQPARLRTVKDEANVFSKDTVEEVNAIVAKIKKQHGKDLLIETVAEGPEKEQAPNGQVIGMKKRVSRAFTPLSRRNPDITELSCVKRLRRNCSRRPMSLSSKKSCPARKVAIRKSYKQLLMFSTR